MARQRDILARLEQHRANLLTHYGVGRWTFPLIHRDALAARERFAQVGLRAGMRVGVVAETSYDWVVVDVALQSLGVSVLGVPRDLSQAPLDELAERYDLSLLLTAEPPREDLPYQSRLSWGPENPPALRAARHGAVENEGGLLFSSGSTGTPKCIVNLESSFDGLLALLERLVPNPAQDSLLMFLPFNGYHSRAYTAAALYLGMDVCLADPATALDAFGEFRPSVCHAPPLFYEAIARRIRGSGKPPREAARQLLGGRTRLLFTGMSPVSLETLEFLHEAGIEVFNAYGSMEGGMVSMCLPGANRRGSVGRPLHQGGVRLASDGEIIVTRETPPILGYLDEAGEFARCELFEVRTGDIGRFDEDGYLWVVGRKKNLLTLSTGHKVQAELVEAELETDPRIRKAVVFGEGQAFLSAVLSVEADDSDTRGSIEAHVAELNRLAGDSRPRLERLVVTPVEFTVDDGLLTPELFKPVRAAIESRFLHGGAVAGGPRPSPDADSLAQMLQLWRTLLGVEAHADSNFFEAGGNSLLLAQLVTEIERRWGRRLSAPEVFAAPSPHGLLALLSGRKPASPRSPGRTMAELMADVDGEVRQVLAAGSIPTGGSRDTVLLTGATGYLGSHVLDQLLRSTPGRIRCLVRGPGGRARLAQIMGEYRLSPLSERVEVVEAMLDRPSFGLDPAGLGGVAEGLRAVIHCAAEVNFISPYERLRATNVGGAVNVARLARGAGVPLHFVSTLGLLQRKALAEGDELDERADLAFTGSLSGGYTQSKWAAEYVVRKGAEAGLDCTVHRPGEILANPSTGRWNPSDFIAQVLGTVATLGVAPDLDASMLGGSVEYVARAIVSVSAQPAGSRRSDCFHLAPHRLHLRDFYEALRNTGVHLELLPVAAWVERLAEAQKAGRLPFRAVPLVFSSGGWQEQGEWARRLRSDHSAELLARLDPLLTEAREALLDASARAARSLPSKVEGT